MAYDRHDPRDRQRWQDERDQRMHDRDRGRHDDRGFFERAGDEISSWFGGSDDGRRGDDRGSDRRFESRSWDRDHDRGYGRDYERDRTRNEDRGLFSSGGSSERDYNRNWRDTERSGRGYRPMTGDYGRSSRQADSEQFFAASGIPRGGFGRGDDDRSAYQRSQSPWGRDEYRRTSETEGSREARRDHDPHYAEWRRRHMDELDRDYDNYRREHQSKFESDFGGWRQQRQSKRQMLGQIREHMEVVGDDQKHVGTVDRVAGDRIILTRSDPDSGGAHHSLSCSEIERVEGDQVMLNCSSEQAKQRWRDESRGRALFEREDQGSSGPHVLDRSFEGTYR